VAASLGAWGLKKDEIGQKIYSKEDLNEVLTFLTCLAAFVEARGVLQEVKSQVINTVDHDSNSAPLTTDMEDRSVIRKDKATRRDGIECCG